MPQSASSSTWNADAIVVGAGPAGSGKTRLATAWAERAMDRGERTFLTCFNEPMAEVLAEAVPEHDLLSVGPVQKTLLALEGQERLLDGSDREQVVFGNGFGKDLGHRFVEARQEGSLATVHCAFSPSGRKACLAATGRSGTDHDGVSVPR